MTTRRHTTSSSNYVRRFKNGKACGSDNLPAELRIKIVPLDWKKASICKLYKGMGDFSDCVLYIGIVLLSAAGKVLVLYCVLPESQCGFRSGRGKVDGVIVDKQLQEKKS